MWLIYPDFRWPHRFLHGVPEITQVDQALSLTGHFEGILGLGRPPDRERANLAKVQVPGFLERAHVQRFSMCFNHNAPGVLGFGTPTHRKPLSSVGKAHWSLNFHGITFGQEKLGDNLKSDLAEIWFHCVSLAAEVFSPPATFTLHRFSTASKFNSWI